MKPLPIEPQRILCYQCFWPKDLCWCHHLKAMEVRTKFVFLMHPKEFKQEKAGTGRLAHLSLKDSEIHMGVEFESHTAVQKLLKDPQYAPFLLYPGDDAVNVSEGGLPIQDLQGRRLLIFLLDGTWACAKKMLRLSPSLQSLPRLMFTPLAKSRFVIKQQPHEWCLSTLEATHELMLALEKSGLDQYPLPNQMIDVFMKMQKFQMDCAADPQRQGYRHKPYRPPEVRTVNKQPKRRNLFMDMGVKGFNS